jgi:hypothetical protein
MATKTADAAAREQLHTMLDQFQSAAAAFAAGAWHREDRAANIATHVANLKTQVDQLTDPNPPVPQPGPEDKSAVIADKDAEIARLKAQLAGS